LETASWESKLELLHSCVPKLEIGNKVDGGASEQGGKRKRGIAYAGGDLVEDISGWLFLTEDRPGRFHLGRSACGFLRSTGGE